MKKQINRRSIGLRVLCLIAVTCLVCLCIMAVPMTARAEETHSQTVIGTAAGALGADGGTNTDNAGAADSTETETDGTGVADSMAINTDGASIVDGADITDTADNDMAGDGGTPTDKNDEVGATDEVGSAGTETDGMSTAGSAADTTDTADNDTTEKGGTSTDTVAEEIDNNAAANAEPSGEDAAKKWLHEQLPNTLASWLSVALGAVTAVAVTLGKVKKAHGSLTESVNKMQDVKAEWLNSSEEWQKAKELYEQTAACMKEVADESREAWRAVDEWRKETQNRLDKLVKGVKLGLCNTEELVSKGYAKDIAAALSDTPSSTEPPKKADA